MKKKDIPWKRIAAVAGCTAVAFVLGYKIGFDFAYTTQVPYSYRDPSWTRYFTGTSLDISAFDIKKCIRAKS